MRFQREVNLTAINLREVLVEGKGSVCVALLRAGERRAKNKRCPAAGERLQGGAGVLSEPFHNAKGEVLCGSVASGEKIWGKQAPEAVGCPRGSAQ